MFKSYKAHNFVNGLRFSCVKSFKESRFKIIISLSLIFIAFLTGVFVAIKLKKVADITAVSDYCLANFSNGILGSMSVFMSRLTSLVFIVGLLSLCSFTIFLIPVAEVILIYRAYLLGVNLLLMIMLHGISGIITAVIVVLPCQICMLVTLTIYYIVFLKINKNRKNFGKAECNRGLFVLSFILILLCFNIIETILLYIFKANVILVI